MNCPKCNEKTHVQDVRHEPEANETYRLYACKSCGFKFHTIEFEAEADAQFKKDWRKLNRSILRLKRLKGENLDDV